MIKKLRYKFILVNMALVTVVLAATFITVFFSTYKRIERESKQLLSFSPGTFENNGYEIKPPRREIGLIPSDAPEFLYRKDDVERFQNRKSPLMILDVSSEGEVTDTFFAQNVDISDTEVLSDMVDKILSDNDEYGIIRSEKLRYKLIFKHDGGYRIVFCDRTDEIATLQSLLRISLLVGAGSLSVFLLISIFLSKWILRPVEKSWKQQTRFVADASHELKTPVTVILANIGIVLDHKDETVESQSKWLEYIKTEVKRMSGLVNDMLYLAKSDHEKTDTVLDKVDFSNVAMSSVLAFEPVAFEQKKTLDSNIESDIFIYGDKSKLTQLCMILLDNAVKYSGEKGSVSVTLNKSQDRVKLIIYNSGVKISTEQLEHIFERFYRADESRARDNGGYGLGLSIAKSIADTHKAKITAQSDEKGTTFTVSFRGKTIECQ